MSLHVPLCPSACLSPDQTLSLSAPLNRIECYGDHVVLCTVQPKTETPRITRSSASGATIARLRLGPWCTLAHHRKGATMDETTLAALTPMWQRIANGEVDLSKYTDEEILSGEIIMADGRRLPKPPDFPDTWVREQVRRGLRVAQRKIREGALEALEVYDDIMRNEEAEDKDRLKAGAFFLERFLGKPDQHVHVHDANAEDAREVLIQRLLAARQGLPVQAAAELAATGRVTDDTVDAELVEAATITLEDLL